MTGTVVTFYSYKGGVGRTFALANTAALLSRWGYRTLCVDWDLDAPGLSYYFRIWQAADPSCGLVDLIGDFARGRKSDPDAYTVPIDLPGAAGRLDLLPAGSGDDEYVRLVQNTDWPGLYERHGLGEFLETCRARWKADYDFVLVDSRTGITDIGGICTAQLPEVLVMLFTANEQSLRGTLDVARRATLAHDALPYDRAGLMIMPVPARFDGREEYQRAEAWQRRFAEDLLPIVGNWASRYVSMERLLGHLTIPYVSYWSFGEDLPALVETEPTPEKISYSLESLAALIAHRLDRTDLLAESRDSFVAAAARAGRHGAAADRYDIYLSYGRSDDELAGHLARELGRRSLRVFLPSRDVAFREALSSPLQDAIANARNLLVIVGEKLGSWQSRDAAIFLRQTVDEGSNRLVIPVLAPARISRDVPTILGQFQVERLRDVSDEAVTTLVHRVVRAISAAGTVSVGSTAVAGTIRDDARDTLSDVAQWQLDRIRWQLVDQCVDAVAVAVDHDDEKMLRVATADLELLGPVRVSGLGSQQTAEVPAELRERIETLIGRLDGEPTTGSIA